MSTFYDDIGGSPTIRGMVKRFEGVAEDEVLRPLLPEPDLAAAKTLRDVPGACWGGRHLLRP